MKTCDSFNEHWSKPKTMSHSCPLHQRHKWQLNDSGGKDEQNSHSNWNLTSSKSQTTYKERWSFITSQFLHLIQCFFPLSSVPNIETRWHAAVELLFCLPVRDSLICCICSVHPRYLPSMFWKIRQASILFRRGPHTLSTNGEAACNKKCILRLKSSGFALKGLLISVVLCEGKRGETSPWVSGQYQATAMPIRIRPISGLVCGLELTDNTDHVSITQTTTLHLEEIIGRVGTHFTHDSDNGESCCVILFFIFFLWEKRSSLLSDPIPIFHLAAWSIPHSLLCSPAETFLRILNQQQASSVSQYALQIHIKLECFWRWNTNVKKV